METGLILAIIGLVVAGLASMLGIWMERDPRRPPRWAIGLSILIGLATVVSLFQSIADARASAKTEEDLARMLQTLEKISVESGQENPALNNFISKEMETQSRSNPDIIKRVAERVTAEGGDANALLAKHLPASELKGLGADKAAKAAAASNSPDTGKLKSEIATLKKKLADAEAKQKKAAAAEKAAEEAQKEKAESDAKIKELNKELERLQKLNERLRGRTTSGGTRWDKG